MERERLEHVLGACVAITLCWDFRIVGIQAVLGGAEVGSRSQT